MNPPPQPVVRVTPSGRLDFERVAPDQIVTVDGRPGLFTPLVGVDPTDVPSTDNLEKVIDLLRQQIARLQSENADLAAKLAQAQSQATSGDDLASAMQHSLDTLQERLADMGNATSNFAVREFSLESKVLVDVTSLGTIGFRFVQPGDDVNPAALSTVSITVVPVPKPATEPGPDAPEPGVDAIDGLTAAQADKLRAAHVTTAGSFWRVATKAATTASLVSLLGIDRDTLGRYTMLAGLLMVPGLDRLKAAVLYDAGVIDAATLAASQPDELVHSYTRASALRPDDDGFRPTTEQAAEWIAAAARLSRATPEG